VELYKRVETDVFVPEHKVSVGPLFVTVRVGWFSYAFLREEEPIGTAADKAIQLVEAIRQLEE
jgi:hypothetical protein